MKSAWRLLVAMLAAGSLAAAAQTEVTFYYPVAVGGPITKIVDQMAADFEKENPSIKVKPVERTVRVTGSHTGRARTGRATRR